MKHSSWNNKKILVTGGAGFLGNHVVNKLLERGVSKGKIFIPRSKDYDLRLQKTCMEVVKGVNIVIHLAANAGGIGYNRENPGVLFYDNIMMCVHIMEEARKAGVEKFIGIGTVCAYPKFTPVPFKEKDLWNGYPEETNAAYGLARKMMLVQGQAYRQQYGFKAIHLLLVNLYGPGDHGFTDPKKAHVMPDLIRKFIDAKRNNLSHVEVWGTGRATREFLYVGDAAKAIIMATEEYDKAEPVNVGSSFEISIGDLAKTIASVVGYTGDIVFDKTKPDGQPRRKLDTKRAEKEFGFKSKTSFKKGLEKTLAWYEKQSSTKT